MESIRIITQVSSFIGASICMGLGAIGAGIGEGYTAEVTCESIARQPSASSNLVKNMLIGQAVCETASIFALVIAIVLIFGSPSVFSLEQAAAYIGAGFAMGFGALGSGVGAGIASGKANAALARRPDSMGTITANMLIGQAVSQTSAIFALVIAFLLVFLGFEGNSIIRMAALLGAGISVGLGAVGPGYGTGLVAASACDATGRKIELSSVFLRTMLLGQAVSQSTSIYSLVIAFVLIFIV